jgi:hypothetical protein
LSEVAQPAAPTPQPIAAKAPDLKVAPPPAAPPAEVDDTEEYIVDGKPVRWTKAQRQLNFQKALAADKRLKEAADTRNRAEELLKLFESDPEAALARVGKDPAKLIAAHLEKKAKLEMLTPEQRETQRLQQERDELRAKVEAAEKEKLTARQAEVDKRNWDAIEQQLIAAADKAGLDADPETLESLADIALEYAEARVPISADQVAQEHQRRERESIEKRDKKMLAFLKGKKLLSYLGPEVLAAVKAAQAEADAASLAGIPQPQARPKAPAKTAARDTRGYVRETDFDKKFLK